MNIVKNYLVNRLEQKLEPRVKKITIDTRLLAEVQEQELQTDNHQKRVIVQHRKGNLEKKGAGLIRLHHKQK